MFLITSGDTGVITPAIVVDRQEDVTDAITRLREHIRHAGGDPAAQIVVNPVGPAIW